MAVAAIASTTAARTTARTRVDGTPLTAFPVSDRTRGRSHPQRASLVTRGGGPPGGVVQTNTRRRRGLVAPRDEAGERPRRDEHEHAVHGGGDGDLGVD